MQRKETLNSEEVTDFSTFPRAGRIASIDPGMKRVGIAISDEMQTVVRPLCVIERRSWKNLLSRISGIVSEFDAKALVIGLPLEFDGVESEMSAMARDLARKFELSLSIPVYLQDERVTSYEAKGRLWNSGMTRRSASKMIDSEAAAIILEDFLGRVQGPGR